MPPESVNVIFSRSGTDANLNDFRHDLIYSQTNGKEQVFVVSMGMDPDGAPFREEWEHSEGADVIVELLTGSEYLSLTREEFERDLLPNLAMSSPALAKEVTVLVDDNSDFCGDW